MPQKKEEEFLQLTAEPVSSFLSLSYHSLKFGL